MVGMTGSAGITRRSLLGTGAAALVAGGLARGAAAAEKLVYITPFGFLMGFAPVLNAAAGGHFEAQGFDAQIVGGNGSSSALQQVLAGRAKFTRVGSIDVIRAIAEQDAPFRAIATIIQGSVYHVVSPRSKPIRSPADMVGKTIGIISVGGVTENLLNLMLVNAGLKPEQVTRQVVGNNPGAYGLIQAGRIDGMIVSLEPLVGLLNGKADVHVFNTDDFAPMPGEVYVATEETIRRDPDTCVRFLRAIKASVEELVPDEEEKLNTIIDRMTGRFEIVGANRRKDLRDIIARVRDGVYRAGPQNVLRNSPEKWQAARDQMAKAGIATVADAKRLYTNAIVDRI